MRSWKAIFGTLVAPVETFRALAEAPRTLLALVLVIAANLAVPAALSGRLDTKTVALMEAGPAADQMTDRELGEAIAQKQKLAMTAEVAKALVGPPLLSLELAIVFWLWGRYLRGKPAFGVLYALCTHAQLPLALRSLAKAAVLTTRDAVLPDELPSLLPSGLAGVVHAPGPWVHVLGGADLFLLWTGVLLGVALYAAGKLPALRAAVGMGLAYAAFVAVFLVGLPGLMGGA